MRAHADIAFAGRQSRCRDGQEPECRGRRSAGAAVTALRTAALSLAAALLVACATPAPDGKPAPKQSAKQVDKPLQPVRVDIQQDATGFTILEDVRVGPEIRSEYESAVRLLEQQRHEEGIAALLEVVESAPNVTAARIDLGIAYAQVGDLDRAEESLKNALQLNPRHPIAYNELGMVYRRKGRFTDAKASYEKALELFPAFHFAQRNLAILCDLYLGDLSCALAHYQAYQLAAPDDEQTAKWIADLNNRAKR